MNFSDELVAPSVAEFEALVQFLYLAPVGLAQTRLDGEIVMVNPICAQLLMPLSHDGGLTNLFDALRGVAPDLLHRVRDFGDSHGKVCDALHIHLDAGVPGSRDPQVLSLSLLKLDADRLMAVLDDVSVAVRRERELRHSQAWIQTMVNSVCDYALVTLDRHGRVQGWNAGIGAVTGFDAAASLEQPFALFFGDTELPAWRAAERLREADACGWNVEEGWLQRADGRRYWASSLITPLRDANGLPLPEPAFSLIIRDLDDSRDAREALRRSIWCDHLTGLANRRAFFEAAGNALRRCAAAGQPWAVVTFDADRFKAVNDSFGHPAGDAVLRHLAAALSSTFRSSDIVARFGGEQFVVLVPGAGGDEALAVAERLCRHVAAHPAVVDGLPIAYTVSAGVAAAAAGDDRLDDCIKRADAALYSAKANGRDRAECWHEQLAAARGRRPARTAP